MLTWQESSSLPVRGAWIEINSCRAYAVTHTGRSPCGERGLKFVQFVASFFDLPSLPVRGAWIEITSIRSPPSPSRVAPRAGSVD